MGGRRPTAHQPFGRARVVELDEWGTSAKCHVCGDRLQGIVDRAKNRKQGLPAGAIDRGLKRCNRNSCSSFLDRDVNVRAVPPPAAPAARAAPLLIPPHSRPRAQAALNILKLLVAKLRGDERPYSLRRDSVPREPSRTVFQKIARETASALHGACAHTCRPP